MTRAVLWAGVPLTLLLPLWVWAGRILFGVGGWLLLVLVPVALVALVLLAVSTALGLTRRDRPRRLTVPQAACQVAVWVALLVSGLAMPDFGDTEDSAGSPLTQVFGYSDGLLDASTGIAFGTLLLALVLWVVLLVLLLTDRGERPVTDAR